MKIAVIGTGHVGGTLGRRWAQLGHEVVFGSRDPTNEKVLSLLEEAGDTASAVAIDEAAAGADVVVLAMPWNAAQETARQLGDLAGKTVVDCTNPLNASFDGLDLGFTTSAAEQIAAWCPGANVVKAFNSISARTMSDAQFGQHKASMFYCGDDKNSKQQVRELAESLGLEPIDAGPLVLARQVEPFAMLYIHLAVREGWGSNCAFKILTR